MFKCDFQLEEKISENLINFCDKLAKYKTKNGVRFWCHEHALPEEDELI